MGSGLVTMVANSVHRHDQSIRRIQHLETAGMCRRLEMCRWIRNILFSEKAHFTRDGVNNTRNSHLCDRNNPHGTVESNYQRCFSVNVWCGVICD